MIRLIIALPTLRKFIDWILRGNFSTQGPFTVPRSEQGHPVLIQAGQSGRGQRFAARWAELVFVAYPNLETGRRNTPLSSKMADRGETRRK